MPQTLYTLGYEKRSIDEYLDLLLEAQISVLVDVRETAWSHKPGFSKMSLSAALDAVGIVYVHASFAGNPKALRIMAPTHVACLAAYRALLTADSSILPRFESLVGGFLREGAGVCLTCFERHAEDCHRSILAEAWQHRGRRRVKHLAVDGCPRLINS
jgi:uncharacterized protein (DUF488 family)